MVRSSVIRFNPEDDAKGYHFLILNTPEGTGLRGNIYVVPEEALEKLDKAGFKYEVLKPESRAERS